jgi:hypothetical protein
VTEVEVEAHNPRLEFLDVLYTGKPAGNPCALAVAMIVEGMGSFVDQTGVPEKAQLGLLY